MFIRPLQLQDGDRSTQGLISHYSVPRFFSSVKQKGDVQELSEQQVGIQGLGYKRDNVATFRGHEPQLPYL